MLLFKERNADVFLQPHSAEAEQGSLIWRATNREEKQETACCFIWTSEVR